MKIRKILYIGVKNTIHDRRFIESLEQISEVGTYFVHENGRDPEINFGSYDCIVAAPLTESISKIPNNISIPIIGVFGR